MRDAFQDVAEEVRAKVAQHLWGASALYTLTDEGKASEDEEVSHTHRRRGLKSGKVCTTDSVVVKRVQCHMRWFSPVKDSLQFMVS